MAIGKSSQVKFLSPPVDQVALAVPFHVMCGESHIIGPHIVVGLLAFVAGGRLPPTSLQPRR